MKLSKVERWILSNQFRILEHLDPDHSEHYRMKRKALERGYKIVYSWISEEIEDSELSEEKAKEVLDILTMYNNLQYNFKQLENTSEIDVKYEDLKFPGFSGNDETKQLGFVRFLEEEQGKFKKLDKVSNSFNSHFPMLETYRPQLKVWNDLEKKHKLTADEIEKVVKASK